MTAQRQQKIKNIWVLLNLMPIIYILAIFAYIFFASKNYILPGYNIQLMISTLVFISLLIIIQNMFMYYKLKGIIKLEKEDTEAKINHDLCEKNLRLLRCQRHDFMNHLQVILGYLQVKRTIKAIDYIKNINTNFEEIRTINNLSMPEISVLLINKRHEAEKYNIKFNYNLKSDLSNTQVKEHDIVKILSNLIDSTIYEIKNNNIPYKKIHILIEKSSDKLFMEVSNNDVIIDRPLKQVSQTKSLLTYNLHNIIKLVEDKYKGKIEIKSKKNLGTMFRIAI
ncbi:MAG: Spo0B domain-containing protein [Clostridiales bacterium]|nr:Spo0B domain-containing protein [Clostridiales bacterium]MCF8022022.1 Spo0B domain-containing protein [Clostridiales bacterium]